MYRAVVRWQVRRGWTALGRRDVDTLLDAFADEFEYTFVGDHALGGTRNTKASMKAWFERIFRLLPDLDFEVRDVVVRGWPWATRAVVLVGVSGRIDGEPYSNEVAQTIDIRWGRIVRIRTLEDTQKLAGALDRLERSGVDEAHAPAIVDPLPV